MVYDLTAVFGQLILCVIAGDVIAGFFHWLEDTYCRKKILFNVCDENINHHRDPNAMGRDQSFAERNKVTVWLLIAGWLMCGVLGLWVWQVWLMLFVAAMGNEIHYINHRPYSKLNPVQKFLTDSALIQTRAQHNRHHRYPYNNNYCVILSLPNEVLDRLNVWRGLEWLVAKVSLGRIVPQRTLESRDGF